MRPIATSTSDELFSRINIDDFEKTPNFQNKEFLLIFAIFRLTVCKQELL